MNKIKQYSIELEKIKSTFNIKDGRLTHGHCHRFKLLPYITDDKKLVLNFTGVVGEFSRNMSKTDLKDEFDSNDFINNVVEQIEDFKSIGSKEALKDIVKSIFIDDSSLVDFDMITMNYILSTKEDEKIAKFLYSIFLDEELTELFLQKYNENQQNILYDLVLKALPDLESKEYVIDKYKCYMPFIKDLFKKDFKFLISDAELYKKFLKRFLEYYYMFYISQLVMKLKKFEKADLNKPEILYYTLNWESTSKNRTAYKFGWDFIKKDVDSLFSHAITLELLNHHGLDEQLDYVELFKVITSLDENNMIEEIEQIYEIYTNNIKDIRWDRFKSINYNSSNKAFDMVHKLFEAIEYQFKNTSRSRPREGYKNWYEKFVYKNFGKRRGPLGYNLNINEEDIILLTKICIANKDKLKLNILFEEFEKRGIFFDRDSKMKIIELYERLNLLEKKSDSGDAQYVKSVL